MEVAGYTITRCIAKGGMATAYLAEQTSLGRQVVLKVLDRAASRESEIALRRFVNEARLVASVNHPHIITIYDIGIADDHVYISMEYVAGGDLKERLLDGPLPEREALDILAKVASGLGAAHSRGIVHRDLKPGNILFRRDGTPLISDFGIAKSLATDGDLTATGVFLGSPNYMAPEQADTRAIDGRADLYALGIILYEMLTGQKPYQSTSVVDVIYMHRQAPLPRLPGSLRHLQGLLDLMLAKDPRDRFRDVPALLHHLSKRPADAACGTDASGTPAGTRPATRVDLSGRPPRWRQRLLVGALVLALAGHGALFALERRLENPARARDPGSAADLERIRAAAAAPPVEAAGDAPQPNPAAVRDALAWLAQHSVAEQRLTSPVKDNAYYYYSRLLALDPDSAIARQGMREIATSYALLAEQALARGDPALARSYVSIGRQIDGGSDALAAVSALAHDPPRGLWAAVRDWLD